MGIKAVNKWLKQHKAKFKYRTECPFCNKKTLYVYEVTDRYGVKYRCEVCRNKKCEVYADLDCQPLKGGR